MDTRGDLRMCPFISYFLYRIKVVLVSLILFSTVTVIKPSTFWTHVYCGLSRRTSFDFDFRSPRSRCLNSTDGGLREFSRVFNGGDFIPKFSPSFPFLDGLFVKLRVSEKEWYCLHTINRQHPHRGILGI